MFPTFIDAPQWRATVDEEDFAMKLRDARNLVLSVFTDRRWEVSEVVAQF
jgi:hypothetical protein